jgi:hypothetical protein
MSTWKRSLRRHHGDASADRITVGAGVGPEDVSGPALVRRMDHRSPQRCPVEVSR